MYKIFIIIFLNTLFSQVITDNSFNSSRSIALAGATVSSPGGIESVFYNPANLSNTTKTSFLIGKTRFYEQNFLEHQYYSILYHPTKKTNIALTVQNLGTMTKDNTISLASEKSITISQGYALLEDRNSSLRLGYNLSYLILKQGDSAGPSGDGSDGISGKTMNAFGIDIGVLATLRGKIIMGAFIKNINSPKIGKGSNAQFLPRRLDIGFSYLPIKKLKTSFVYERVLTAKNNQFRFGIEYELFKHFILRSGVQMKPNRLGFGFIASINDKSSFGYGVISHHVLPLTHNVEIGFYF